MLVVNLPFVSKSSLTFKDSEPLMMTGNIFLEIISVLLLGGGKNQCTRRGNGGEKYLFFSPQDSRFVEDRRRLLQDYLRRVVNLYVTEDRELRENTSKAVLLQIIPFFA